MTDKKTKGLILRRNSDKSLAELDALLERMRRRGLMMSIVAGRIVERKKRLEQICEDLE